MKLIDRGKKVEIMLMRKARQVATPISQIWRRVTIGELPWVSGKIRDLIINESADSEYEVCDCLLRFEATSSSCRAPSNPVGRV